MIEYHQMKSRRLIQKQNIQILFAASNFHNMANG